MLIALIAGLPAIIAAVFAGLVHRQVKTPSGDTLGEVAERTHDLSAADVALSRHVLAETSGDQDRAERIVSDTLAALTRDRRARNGPRHRRGS